MKRFVGLVAVLVLLSLSVLGCNGGSGGSSAKQNTSDEQKQKMQEQMKKGMMMKGMPAQAPAGGGSGK
jgi:hypothetical protein